MSAQERESRPEARSAERSPANDADARCRALERTLTGRFWLRFHMSLMLAAAFVAGALANHFLIAWRVDHAALRWIVALGVAYATFFVAMPVWLAYVGARPLGGVDVGNALQSSGSGGGRSVDVPTSAAKGIGGGGRFGGGGASGSFVDAAPRPAMSATASAQSAGKGGGFGVDLGGDDGDFVVLLLITLAITAALVGGVVYLLVAAPHLLADVAFGAAVAHGFGRGVRKASADPGWTGSVLAATWKPFLAAGVTLAAAGFAFEHYFPGVHTLGSAWRRYV